MRSGRKRRAILWTRAHQAHGRVACWVCGSHVTWAAATLEHKLPKSKGGTDAWSNLAISHADCNHRRGNLLIAHLVRPNPGRNGRR